MARNSPDEQMEPVPRLALIFKATATAIFFVDGTPYQLPGLTTRVEKFFIRRIRAILINVNASNFLRHVLIMPYCLGPWCCVYNACHSRLRCIYFFRVGEVWEFKIFKPTSLEMFKTVPNAQRL